MSYPITELENMVHVAIPTVYAKGLSYYETLAAVVAKVNELIAASNEYFAEDVQTVMTNILQGWIDDGTLDTLIQDALLDIGDRQYTEQNIVTAGESVTASLDALDMAAQAHIDKAVHNERVNVTDYASIAAAVAAADTLRAPGVTPVLYFPANVAHTTAATVTVPAGIHVIMDGTLTYIGALYEPCIIIGASGVSNAAVNIKIRVARDVQADWMSEACIGALIYNCSISNIHIELASKFTIGVQFMGSAAGFGYNNVTLGYLSNNKIGLDVNNELGGWANENVYINGRFSVSTGVHVNLDRWGVRITSKAAYHNNNNVFIKPSFELNKPNITADAYPILIDYGIYNSFWKIRNEGNTNTAIATMNNSSAHNQITSGYGDVFIVDNSTNPTTDYEAIRDVLTSKGAPIFLSGALHKRAAYYDGATNVNVPGVHLVNTSNSTPYTNRGSIVINNDHLDFAAGGVGIFIDTTNQKRFVVKRDCMIGYGGRVAVRCYDAAGVILTSADAGHPYVKGQANQVFGWSSNAGGVYQTGGDSTSNCYFIVGADVAYIDVLLLKGTNNLKIRAFAVHGVDNLQSAAWTGVEEIIPGANIATVAPSAGTWAAGRVIYNAAPSSGQPIGWVCTVAGTPGTWLGFGVLL